MLGLALLFALLLDRPRVRLATVISGSSGTGFLSPGISYDTVELS